MGEAKEKSFSDLSTICLIQSGGYQN